MAKRKIDLLKFSIIRWTYDNIAREMAIALEYSSWSTAISICRDFSTVIVDSSFNLIAVLDKTIPGQAIGLQRLVRNMERKGWE